MRTLFFSLIMSFSLKANNNCLPELKKVLKAHKDIHQKEFLSNLREENILFKDGNIYVIESISYRRGDTSYSASPIVITEKGEKISLNYHDGKDGWAKGLKFPSDSDLSSRGLSLHLQDFKVNKKSKKVYAVYSMFDHTPGPSGFTKPDTGYVIQIDLKTGKRVLLDTQSSSRAASREITILDEKKNIISISGHKQRSSDPYAAFDESQEVNSFENTYRIYRNKLRPLTEEEIEDLSRPTIKDLTETNDPNFFYESNTYWKRRNQAVWYFDIYKMQGNIFSSKPSITITIDDISFVPGLKKVGTSPNPRFSNFLGISFQKNSSKDKSTKLIEIYEFKPETDSYKLVLKIKEEEIDNIRKSSQNTFFGSDFDKKLKNEFVRLLD